MVENSEFWEQLEKVFERIKPHGPDQTFNLFLNCNPDLDPDIRWLAREYVEGFHAASINQIGVHALALAESAAAKEVGTRQFHLTEGYAALIDWFVTALRDRGVKILCEHPVTSVDWEPNAVEV